MTHTAHTLHRWRLICCTGILFSGLLLTVAGTLHARTMDESIVKAALVLNFARYTRWPKGSFEKRNSPCELVVIGTKDMAGAFQALEGKAIGSRPLHVRFGMPPEGLEGIHIVFISHGTSGDDLLVALGAVESRPVLTIGDEVPHFTARGGVINIFKKNDRLRFEINVSRATQQGLKFRSRLLRHAIIVGD